jgi:hypothetical protein
MCKIGNLFPSDRLRSRRPSRRGYATIANLTPRPIRPSLNRGRVQRRLRRAFLLAGKSVLSTSELLKLTHVRPGHSQRRDPQRCLRQHLRQICRRYCERVGRASTIGHPVLWRLKPEWRLGVDESDV